MRTALIFAAAIPLLALVVFGVMLGGIPLYRRVQGKLDGVTAATRENLGGVRVIRAFRKEEQEIEKFGKVNREQTALQDKAGRLSALMNPLTYVLVNRAVVLIIRQSGAPVNAGTLTQGQVVALVNYMAQILGGACQAGEHHFPHYQGALRAETAWRLCWICLPVWRSSRRRERQSRTRRARARRQYRQLLSGTWS